MATRFLPMSWRSPLTVPITTTPRGLTPALARWGSSLASPAFMARAATRTSGMKTSLALNWTPRRSMPGIRPSFRMVAAGVPAASAWSTSDSTSAFFPAIRASCISLSISSLLPKNARPRGPILEHERKAHIDLDDRVPERSGGRRRLEDVDEAGLVPDMKNEPHAAPRLGHRPRPFKDQAEIRGAVARRDPSRVNQVGRGLGPADHGSGPLGPEPLFGRAEEARIGA